MSTWVIWCVDGDDRRLSTKESDITFTWEWIDRWTLQAILPPDQQMKIDKDGILTHFHCENVEHPGIALMASLDWDVAVDPGASVVGNSLKLKMDEGAILLMEEYLPIRPA
jgi:hypothetical protein